MERWLWAVIFVLVCIIIALAIKIYLMRKSAEEMEKAFAERLTTDTNVLIDISSRDRYMRHLAESMNIQLRRLRRERHRFLRGDLELKTAVTNISHDLRTPLTAICGYLELLEDTEKNAAVERYIGIIKNRTEILIQLTEELFRYSVITSPDTDKALENVEVNEVLEESIAGFYAVICERKITPNIHITETKVVRKLNREALSRTFSNLINNAVKYSEGDLDITLDDTGRILFANTAPGLDKVQVGKLFERFYTVETARNSTGLGLSIAKVLVEQMNGQIDAEYENGKLSICIKLPEE
jgi:signal transduction histidine kinase